MVVWEAMGSVKVMTGESRGHQLVKAKRKYTDAVLRMLCVLRCTLAPAPRRQQLLPSNNLVINKNIIKTYAVLLTSGPPLMILVAHSSRRSFCVRMLSTVTYTIKQKQPKVG